MRVSLWDPMAETGLCKSRVHGRRYASRRRRACGQGRKRLDPWCMDLSYDSRTRNDRPWPVTSEARTRAKCSIRVRRSATPRHSVTNRQRRIEPAANVANARVPGTYTSSRVSTLQTRLLRQPCSCSLRQTLLYPPEPAQSCLSERKRADADEKSAR